jgi:hypothetical protein
MRQTIHRLYAIQTREKSDLYNTHLADTGGWRNRDMTKMRQNRLSGYLAGLLVFAMYVGPSTQAFAATKPAQPVVKHRIIVFPFAVPKEVGQPESGTKIADVLTSMLKDSDQYTVQEFSKRHPSLQRAILVERTLDSSDVDGPFGAANKATALKIAREMGGDLMVIGDVESFKYDADKGSGEELISAQLVDVRTEKSIKSLAVTGRTAESSKIATEEEAAAIAAGDAVTKIVDDFGIKPPVSAVNPKAGGSKRSSRMKTLLFAVLLGVGVGLAGGGSSSSSNGSGGGGGTEPPPAAP